MVSLRESGGGSRIGDRGAGEPPTLEQAWTMSASTNVRAARECSD